MNDLLHLEQACGLSPVWILSCVFKALLLVNELSHLGQLNGFSPVWILSCTFKLPLVLNAFSHLEQANGFSPVWVLSCAFKLPLSINDFSHLEQANGFSPVWVLKENFGEKTHHCKQCDKKFSKYFPKKKQETILLLTMWWQELFSSSLLFRQKRDAKFLVTLFAMKGFVTKVFFHGYGEKSTRSRQMTSLLCVSFHASSNHNFVEMLYHTWNI